MEIEREIHSAPGQLRGPTTSRHQVDRVTVNVERLPDNRLRVSTPGARGWAAVASNQVQLAAAIAEAFTETQVAAYAKWRGQRYDLDELTDTVDGDPMAPPRARQRRPRSTAANGYGRQQLRPDTHSPADWVKTDDGRWRSPAGMTYGAQTTMALRIVARRRDWGLPV